MSSIRTTSRMRQPVGPPLAVRRDGEDHREHGELRGLDLDRSEGEPPLRAERVGAERRLDQEQRSDREHVRRASRVLEAPVVDPRDDEHDDGAEHDEQRPGARGSSAGSRCSGLQRVARRAVDHDDAERRDRARSAPRGRGRSRGRAVRRSTGARRVSVTGGDRPWSASSGHVGVEPAARARHGAWCTRTSTPSTVVAPASRGPREPGGHARMVDEVDGDLARAQRATRRRRGSASAAAVSCMPTGVACTTTSASSGGDAAPSRAVRRATSSRARAAAARVAVRRPRRRARPARRERVDRGARRAAGAEHDAARAVGDRRATQAIAPSSPSPSVLSARTVAASASRSRQFAAPSRSTTSVRSSQCATTASLSGIVTLSPRTPSRRTRVDDRGRRGARRRAAPPRPRRRRARRTPRRAARASASGRPGRRRRRRPPSRRRSAGALTARPTLCAELLVGELARRTSWRTPSSRRWSTSVKYSHGPRGGCSVGVERLGRRDADRRRGEAGVQVRVVRGVDRLGRVGDGTAVLADRVLDGRVHLQRRAAREAVVDRPSPPSACSRAR